MSKKIKIILKKDYENVGKKNNIVYATRGYTVNYLIPNNIAVIATQKAIQQFKNFELIEKQKIKENKKKIEALKTELNVINKVIIFKKMGENQYIFGSISDKDIIEKISDYAGIQLNKKHIEIPNIKKIGRFHTEIHLQHEELCRIQVHILPTNI